MIKQNIEKFTPSQEVALQKLKAFMKKRVDPYDISTRVFVLSGKAGTGKTTIIKYALANELKEDMENIGKDDKSSDMFNMPNVIGVTMSHKARNVLAQSIHITRTFAGAYGLKPIYHEDGSIEFARDSNTRVDMLDCRINAKAFVHDECSMYDFQMLDYTLKDTNSYSKIIFMGDPGQLPPVNYDPSRSLPDDDSPVFSLMIPDENKHTLLERNRQTEGNPIIELSDIVYDQIFGDQDLNIVYNAIKQDKVADEVGYRCIPYASFLKDFKGISNNYLDTKVVAYTNKKVDMFNDVIRKHLLDNPIAKFVEGDIIYMKDSYAYYPEGDKNKASRTFTCYNSDEYVVTKVGSKDIKDVNCDILFIDKTGHRHLAEFTEPFVPVVSASGVSDYNRKSYLLSQNAKQADQKTRRSKWKMFYEFSDNFAKVSYGYCFTGYKVQGSGYKNVYIDINDIVTVGPISNKRKLQAIYTALTRATHMVVFLRAN